MQRSRCFYRLVVPILLLAGVLLSARPAAGQIDTRLGLRLGVASTTIDGGAQSNRGRRTGLMGGGYVRLGAHGWVSFQPELLYVQKGASKEFRAGGTTVTEVDKLGVIEVPLLVRVHAPSETVSPTLFAGPVVGKVVQRSSTIEADGPRPANLAAPISPSVSGLGAMIGTGLGVDLNSRTVTFEARYQFEPHTAQNLGSQRFTFSVGVEQ